MYDPVTQSELEDLVDELRAELLERAEALACALKYLNQGRRILYRLDGADFDWNTTDLLNLEES